MRRAALAIAGCATAACVFASAAASSDRRHPRLHLPPPRLAHGLTVDATEYRLRPSKRSVAAGPVRIAVYNRGEDPHDLVVVDKAGRPSRIALASGASGVLTPRLAAGSYRLFCSIGAGTAESHEARGMWFVLDVR